MLFQNLKNFLVNIKRDRLLLLALLAGLLLRGMNPTFGSPSLYVSNDEAIAHLSALNMIAQKTPASIANYTPLGAYLQIPFLVAIFLVMQLLGLINTVSDFELFLLLNEGYFLFIPRLISAFFGTLTILVIYKISRELFKNRNIAMLSAFLTAVSFNLVHISHFGRPWSAALFFLALAVYLAIHNKALLSLFFVSISYGFHQVGLLILPIVVTRNFKKLSYRNFIALICLSILIFLFSAFTLRNGIIESIENNQSFLLKDRLLSDLLAGNSNLWNSFIRSLVDNLSLYFAINLTITDGVIFIFGIFGLYLYFKERVEFREILYFIVGYFAFASLFFHPLSRYLLPIVLLSIPFAAFAIYRFFKVNLLVIVAIVIVASINSLWWNQLFVKKPTFIKASEWVEQNVPSDIPVAYTGGRMQTFAPNRESILHMQSVNPEIYGRLLKRLDDSGTTEVRDIVYLGAFPGATKLESFKNASVNREIFFVIDYYLDPKESIYSMGSDNFVLAKKFSPYRGDGVVTIAEPLFDASWNFWTGDLKDKVSMYSLTDTGPYVDVLRVVN